MPDGRFISKSISTSEQLGEVSLAADFLFGRCIPHLDRDGRMSGNPTLIKATVCPLRPDVTEAMIPGLLDELQAVGLVRWYTVDGKQVVQFPNFRTHQRGMKYEREAASRFPAFSPEPQQVRTYSGPTPDQVPLSEVKLSEVNGRTDAPEGARGTAPSPEAIARAREVMGGLRVVNGDA